MNTDLIIVTVVRLVVVVVVVVSGRVTVTIAFLEARVAEMTGTGAGGFGQLAHALDHQFGLHGVLFE